MEYLPIFSTLITVLLVAVSILIVLIVLLQRPKQEGLGTAFGGGTLDSALGAHTTDVLQKVTTWLGVIFFISAISLSMLKAYESRENKAKDILKEVKEREPIIPSDFPGLPKIDDPKPVGSDAPKSDTPKPAAKKDAIPPKPKAEGNKKKEEVPKKAAPPAAPKKPSPAESDKPKK